MMIAKKQHITVKKQEDFTMMMLDYKKYEIRKVTRNTYLIYKDGDLVDLLSANGHYPKTLREAHRIIDELDAQ